MNVGRCAGHGHLRAQPETPRRRALHHSLLRRSGARAAGGRAAKVYAKIVPAVSHAVHMPTHIFIQHGMWNEVANQNMRAFNVARELWQPGDVPGDMSHSGDWGQYGFLQLGEFAGARERTRRSKGWPRPPRTPRLMSVVAGARRATSSKPKSGRCSRWPMTPRRNDPRQRHERGAHQRPGDRGEDAGAARGEGEGCAVAPPRRPQSSRGAWRGAGTSAGLPRWRKATRCGQDRSHRAQGAGCADRRGEGQRIRRSRC